MDHLFQSREPTLINQEKTIGSGETAKRRFQTKMAKK